MKKITVLFLLTCFLFAAVACTQGAQTESFDVDFAASDSEGADYGGIELVLSYNSEGEWGSPDNNLFNYTYNTTNYDAAAQRIKDVEEKYNIDIVYNKLGEGDYGLSSQYFYLYAAGLSIGDFGYESNVDTLWNSMKANVYLPLEGYMDIFDYEKNHDKWGSVYIRELGMYNGLQYALSPFSWPNYIPNVVACIAINEAMITQYGFTDPREYYTDGTWTWDKFLEVIQQYTFADGEKQLFGAVTFRASNVAKMAVLSNGVNIAQVSADGIVSSGMETEAGLQALDWAFSLQTQYSHCFYGNNVSYGSDWTNSLDPFINNEAFLSISDAHATCNGRIANEATSFGVLPFPVGPNGTWGEWAGVYEAGPVFGIWTTCAYPDEAAVIINEICEPFAEFPTRQSILDNYARYVYYDEQDAEIFMSLTDNARYSYWPAGGDNFWASLSNSFGTMTAKETIEANLTSFLEVIESSMAQNQMYIDSLG